MESVWCGCGVIIVVVKPCRTEGWDGGFVIHQQASGPGVSGERGRPRMPRLAGSFGGFSRPQWYLPPPQRHSGGEASRGVGTVVLLPPVTSRFDSFRGAELLSSWESSLTYRCRQRGGACAVRVQYVWLSKVRSGGGDRWWRGAGGRRPRDGRQGAK
uniref:Uncharacterized protein n=1 Tax=Knipowitschia caucasica TaxID=637954 RepID=A0AAV2KRT9_KNICA